MLLTVHIDNIVVKMTNKKFNTYIFISIIIQRVS